MASCKNSDSQFAGWKVLTSMQWTSPPFQTYFPYVRKTYSVLLGTATPLAPLRQLCPVLEDGGFSALFPDATRTDHAGKRVDRTIHLLGHPIVLPQVPLPKPPGCFFLPLPPCLPQSDNCSLYFAAVACPPPEAMHRGQISFV